MDKTILNRNLKGDPTDGHSNPINLPHPGSSAPSFSNFTCSSSTLNLTLPPEGSILLNSQQLLFIGIGLPPPDWEPPESRDTDNSQIVAQLSTPHMHSLNEPAAPPAEQQLTIKGVRNNDQKN